MFWRLGGQFVVVGGWLVQAQGTPQNSKITFSYCVLIAYYTVWDVSEVRMTRPCFFLCLLARFSSLIKFFPTRFLFFASTVTDPYPPTRSTIRVCPPTRMHISSCLCLSKQAITPNHSDHHVFDMCMFEILCACLNKPSLPTTQAPAGAAACRLPRT